LKVPNFRPRICHSPRL